MLELNSISYEVGTVTVLENITVAFDRRRYGLVGANGVGKTTLARVLSGRLLPTRGRVEGRATAALLEQSEARPEGSVRSCVASAWTEHGRQRDLIERLLRPVGPDRDLGTLSGGEWMRVRLARVLSSGPDFLILDEPTNDLDRDGRAVVMDVVRSFRGGVLVISHDRELLENVDEILELTPKGLTRYGAGFAMYWTQRSSERRRQAEEVQKARREKQRAAREQQEKLEKQDRRMRSAERRAAKGGIPRIDAHELASWARATRGRVVEVSERIEEKAEDRLRSSLDALVEDPFLRLDFESQAPPSSRLFFDARNLNLRFAAATRELWDRPLTFVMAGPERWHIEGANGAGKTTLLRLLLGPHPGQVSGTLWRSERPTVYLDQGLSLLDDGPSVLDNFGGRSRFPPKQLRNELAFYGFTGDRVHQRVGTLSGGERLRAALALGFLGETIPQVILLDEPTNNLDFQSIDLLEKALRRFRGLLVLVSHDAAFVENVGVTNRLVLEAGR